MIEMESQGGLAGAIVTTNYFFKDFLAAICRCFTRLMAVAIFSEVKYSH
jgi:hypothetical protein